MRLLDGKLEPITSEFGFVQAPYETVVAWWAERESSVCESGTHGRRANLIAARRVDGGLEASLRSLLPLTAVERRRTLILPTASDWTAVFDSGWRGGDAARLSYAAAQIRCQAVRVVSTTDVKIGRSYCRYGARIFELYGPEKTSFLNYVRAICVANDGGRWRMDVFGAPLPGEDAAWFEPRQARARFHEEHLNTLLRSIGIEAFDDRFYGSGGTLIERRGPTVAGYREYSLSEAREPWGR